MLISELSRAKKVIIILISTLLAVTGSCFAYAYDYLKDFNHVSITQDDTELGISAEESQDTSTDITNIALFGVDSRNGEKMSGNSDSIMIVSVDKQHNKIKLISIMRDTLVRIPDHGVSKITEAYGYGGAVLAIRTLNENFNLNIRDYATVNFAKMADIIDAVGGVEIYVTEDELVNANASIMEQCEILGIDSRTVRGIEEPGLQTLNGIQAVGYARIRKVNNPNGSYGDFGRTDRQREIMEQLFNKALTMEKSQYPNMIKTLLPCVETSLDYGKILNLAGILGRQVTFEQTRVPLLEYVIDAGYYYNGKSTVYYNLDYASDIIHAFIYDDIQPETYIEQNPPVKTGEFDGGSYSDDYYDNNDTSSSYDSDDGDTSSYSNWDDGDDDTTSSSRGNNSGNSSSNSSGNTSSSESSSHDNSSSSSESSGGSSSEPSSSEPSSSTPSESEPPSSSESSGGEESSQVTAWFPSLVKAV